MPDVRATPVSAASVDLTLARLLDFLAAGLAAPAAG